MPNRTPDTDALNDLEQRQLIEAVPESAESAEHFCGRAECGLPMMHAGECAPLEPIPYALADVKLKLGSRTDVAEYTIPLNRVVKEGDLYTVECGSCGSFVVVADEVRECPKCGAVKLRAPSSVKHTRIAAPGVADAVADGTATTAAYDAIADHGCGDGPIPPPPTPDEIRVATCPRVVMVCGLGGGAVCPPSECRTKRARCTPDELLRYASSPASDIELRRRLEQLEQSRADVGRELANVRRALGPAGNVDTDLGAAVEREVYAWNVIQPMLASWVAARDAQYEIDPDSSSAAAGRYLTAHNVRVARGEDLVRAARQVIDPNIRSLARSSVDRAIADTEAAIGRKE